MAVFQKSKRPILSLQRVFKPLSLLKRNFFVNLNSFKGREYERILPLAVSQAWATPSLLAYAFKNKVALSLVSVKWTFQIEANYKKWPVSKTYETHNIWMKIVHNEIVVFYLQRFTIKILRWQHFMPNIL